MSHKGDDDDIAVAADVGRMTVFNHFPRKVDMFFDREEEIQTLAFEAVRGRGPGVSPIDATRKLAHDLEGYRPSRHDQSGREMGIRIIDGLAAGLGQNSCQRTREVISGSAVSIMALRNRRRLWPMLHVGETHRRH